MTEAVNKTDLETSLTAETDADAPELAALDVLVGAPETLLIPLASRARASQDPTIGNFSDPAAEKICAHFDVDIERYAVDRSTMRGVVARGAWYNKRVVRFIKKNPNAVVFSIGSGLNTMYERVAAVAPANGWRWIDTDLSEPVALRRQVFSDSDQRTTLVFDASKPDLPDHDWLTGNMPILFISEAALIYLPEDEVKAVFQMAARVGRTRKACGFLFDWCSPMMVRRSAQHPALKRLKGPPANFQSSMRRGSDVSGYDPGWRIVNESSCVMTKSGFVSTMAEVLFRLFTLGRRVYALADAQLVTGK